MSTAILCCVIHCRWVRIFAHSTFVMSVCLCLSGRMSVCPSVRMHQHGSNWTDFHQIWHWRLLWKSVARIQIWLKSSESIGHFTRKLKYVLLLPATLDRRKSALIDWNYIRLLALPSIRPLLVRLYVHLSAYIRAAVTGRIYVKFNIGDFEKCQFWLKLGKTFGHFTWRPKYVLFFTPLNRHKSPLLKWNGVVLLG